MKRAALIVGFFALLVGVWEVVYRMKVWSPVLLPDPLTVGEYLVAAIKDGTLWQATVVTMKRLLIGYFLSILFGLPLGLLTARFKFASDTLGVLALGLQTLPSVCWIPLALLWYGQTEGAMLFVVIMGSLWSVLIATDNGVRTVPPIYARAARTTAGNSLPISSNASTWRIACSAASHRSPPRTSATCDLNFSSISADETGAAAPLNFGLVQTKLLVILSVSANDLAFSPKFIVSSLPSNRIPNSDGP